MIAPVRGFRGYYVSDRGHVFSNRGPAPTQIRHGYVRARLSSAGQRQWRTVHSLVLEAFHGPRPTSKHEGAHLDGDRENNAATNLAWKTRAENEADKAAHGTQRGGGPRKLSYRRRIAIRRLLCGGASIGELAARYGVHRSTISRAARVNS